MLLRFDPFRELDRAMDEFRPPNPAASPSGATPGAPRSRRAPATRRRPPAEAPPGQAPHYDPAPAKEEPPMAVTAYILIQTEVGKAAQVATAVGAIDGVVTADDVTGPYDVIARAEAASVDELGKMVVSRVQMIDGITRTLTCPVVHL
jgi:DNA-binding Lrp family transcriptional regulator